MIELIFSIININEACTSREINLGNLKVLNLHDEKQ
jgi:hypothetical protein